MKIRAFEARDAGEVAELIAGLAEHHGDEAACGAEDVAELCGGDVPYFTTLVAEEAGLLIGYACLLRIGQLQYGVRGAELHHLYVRPEWRGTGVGARLVEGAIDLAGSMGARFIVVGTEAGNLDAHRFYEAQGFTRRAVSGPRFSKRI